jgi:hypothetical protein
MVIKNKSIKNGNKYNSTCSDLQASISEYHYCASKAQHFMVLPVMQFSSRVSFPTSITTEFIPEAPETRKLSPK